jgi:RHS repeat-associated protein
MNSSPLSFLHRKATAILIALVIIFGSTLPVVPAFAEEAETTPAPSVETEQASSESTSSSGSSSVPRRGDQQGLVEQVEQAENTENTENTESTAVQTDDLSQTTPSPSNIPIPGQVTHPGGQYSLTAEDIIKQPWVHSVSGAAHNRIPQQTPESPYSLSPGLVMEYNSQYKDDQSHFGYNRDMKFGKIYRLNKNGVDQMYANPVYSISLPLVSGEPIEGEMTLVRTSGDEQTYATRRESSFAEMVYNTVQDSWLVTTTDGMKYYLGKTDQSKLRDTAGTMIFAWYIEEVEDTHGITMEYEWLRLGGDLKPKTIKYGAPAASTAYPYEVRFEPFYSNSNPASNRSDSSFSYATGFLIERNHVVDSTNIYVNGQKKISYDYDYLSTSYRTHLKKITLTGKDPNDVTVSQEINFNYYSYDDGYTDPTYHRTDLLRSILFPPGGEIIYDYLPASQFYDDQGNPANPGLRSNLIVVNQLTKKDKQGRYDVSTYQWLYGHFYFYSPVQKEIAGFGLKKEINPLDQERWDYFCQAGGFDGSSMGEPADDSNLEVGWVWIGKPYKTLLFDNAGRKLQEQTTIWEAVAKDQNNQRFFPKATKTITTSYGTSGSTVKSTATTNVYDDENGNTLETISHGEVTAQMTNGFANGQFSVLDPNQERKEIMTYASNAAKHMLSYLSSQEFKNAQGQTVAKTEFKYDNLPLGDVDKGDQTQSVQNYLEQSRGITTVTTYNGSGQVRLITDPLQHAETVTYDNYGFVETVTNALQQTTTYTIDPVLNVVTNVIDPNGYEKQTKYDGIGRLTEEWTMDPNNNNQLVKMKSSEYHEPDPNVSPHHIITRMHLGPQKEGVSYLYIDGFSRILQTREKGGPENGASTPYKVVQTTYDDLGRLSVQTLAVYATGTAYNQNDASTFYNRLQYDSLGRTISEETPTGTTYYDYDGWTLTVTDPNGNTKKQYMNAFSEVRQIDEENEVNSQTVTYSTTLEYDARGYITEVKDEDQNIIVQDYDSLGRLTRYESPHQALQQTFPVYTYEYDDNGNDRFVTNPDGTVIEYTYDELNRALTEQVVGDISTRVSITYDQGVNAIGRISSISSPGSTISYNYDRRGRMTDETRTIVVSTNPLQEETYTKTYSFTRFDQVETMTMPDGLQLQRNYNEIGQLASISSTNISENGGRIIDEIEHNPINLMTSIRRANGTDEEFDYPVDEGYRLMRKQVVSNGLLVQASPSWFRRFLAWAAPSYFVPPTHAQLDDAGTSGRTNRSGYQELKNVSDTERNAAVSSGRRGVGGELLKPEITLGGDISGATASVGKRVYFQARYLNTMLSAEAATKYRVKILHGTELVWDSGFTNLSSPLNAGDTMPVVVQQTTNFPYPAEEYQWQIAFQTTGGTITPWSNVNTFTLAARPVRPNPNGNTYQDIHYTYDNNGNPLTVNNLSGLPGSGNETYTYDKLSRLKTVVGTNKVGASNYSRNYNYDGIGNMTYKSDQGTYEYNDPRHPHAVTRINNGNGTTKTFTYDIKGNLLTMTTQTPNETITKTFSWDHLDRMSSAEVNRNGVVSHSEYLYDHGGTRLMKTTYFGATAEVDIYPFDDYQLTDQNTSKTDIFAGQTHVATVESAVGGGSHFVNNYYGDHLGGADLTADGAGLITETYDYAPYGEILFTEQYNNYKSEKTYTGAEFDEDTETYYMEARYYDPYIAKFLSRDPRLINDEDVFASLGSTEDLNAYSYVKNDPVKYMDPTGEIPLDTIADVGFLIYDVGAIVYDFFATGSKNWEENSMALGADALGTVIPYATGLGMVARTAAKADHVVDAVKAIDKAVDASKAAKTAAKTEKRAVMIGEGMKDNVIPMAEKYGADYYKATNKYGSGSKKALDLNKRWINKQMKEGKKILDAGEVGIKSPHYALEKSQIAKRGYTNVKRVGTSKTRAAAISRYKARQIRAKARIRARIMSRIRRSRR